MKEIKEIVRNTKDILYAPIANILVVFGLAFLIFSFLSVDGTNNTHLTASPNWLRLIIGCALVGGGLIIFVTTKQEGNINRKVKISEGLTIAFGETCVGIRIGRIQDTSGRGETEAVALPANTTFIDDCIRDKSSALGAFMLSTYPDKIAEVAKAIGDALGKSGAVRDADGNYPPGTTIALPPPWQVPINIVITAATVRKELVGIRAEPSTICACVQNIFRITSDKKISKINMPILGSGHGGLEINAALLFLLLSIRHYASYYHHVKCINIMITENDAKRLSDIYRLQYLSLLGEVRK